MNTAREIAVLLRELGVTRAYGVIGEETIELVDALTQAEIAYVTCRHEQFAALLAATEGRLTGRPGVCCSTLGPGATNLMTGLAHAQLGGMPLIALTGQKPVRDNREGSFQVIDVPALAAPVTKFATRVSDAAAAAPAVLDAFGRARAPRPGAVLVELPEDVLGGDVAERHWHVPAVAPVRLTGEAVDRLAATIEQAEAPVVLNGHGAQSRETAEALVGFLEASGLGALSTQMGKGAVPESHPGSLRCLGIHRRDIPHVALRDADLVVAVGYDPVEHPPLAWNPDDRSEVVHLAAWDPAAEPGYRPAHVGVAPLAGTLQALADRVAERVSGPALTARRERRATLRRVIDQCLADERRELGAAADDPLDPLSVVTAVESVVEPASTLALDNGVFKVWFARQHRTVRHQQVLLDNALATMGAGLATGVGAALETGRRAVSVCGDGGFLMNVQGLQTAVELGVDLTIVVLRDEGYGFIAWEQDRRGFPNAAVELCNPDLTALASSFGVWAERAATRTELEAALRRAAHRRGVALIDCPIDYSLNEMLGEGGYERARLELELVDEMLR